LCLGKRNMQRLDSTVSTSDLVDKKKKETKPDGYKAKYQAAAETITDLEAQIKELKADLENAKSAEPSVVVDSNENLDVPRRHMNANVKKVVMFVEYLGMLFGLFWAFVIYMVIGHITSGDSQLVAHKDGTPTSAGMVVLCVFIFLILLLVVATLEGFAFASSTLKLSDLDSVQKSHPVAAKTHNFLFGDARSQVTPKRFDHVLLGRQVILIIIIFIYGQVTSFPYAVNFPWSHEPYPPTLDWFRTYFLNTGICGAFFLVWTAQLIPVLSGTRNPVAILNFPQMYLVPFCCLLVQKVGLTLLPQQVVRGVVKLMPPPPPLQSLAMRRAEEAKKMNLSMQVISSAKK